MSDSGDRNWQDNFFLVIVMACFFLSWLPVIYMTLADIVVGRPDLTPEELTLASLFTVGGSSLVNPFLYAVMKRDFKTQLQETRVTRVTPMPPAVEMNTHPGQ